MPGETNQPSSLSDISHLFLSSLRDKQTGGAARPKRVPPRKKPSVDLTPEEFDRVLKPAADEAPAATPPVKAVLASHFGAAQLDVAGRYAATLAAGGLRVGLIAVDAAELHVITFEQGTEPETQGVPELHSFEAREIRDAINELNCDLDLWLLVIVNPRLPESRNLLRNASYWTLLAGVDHESIVAAYRTLKGVEEIGHPRLSVAPVGAGSRSDAEATFRRLAGVAAQFLQWSAEPETPIAQEPGVRGCTVIHVAGGNEKAQMAADAHWQVVEELLQKARFAQLPSQAAPVPGPSMTAANEPAPEEIESLESAAPVAAPEPERAMHVNMSGPKLVGDTIEREYRAMPGTPSPSSAAASDVIDLPDPEAGVEGILEAVIRASGGQLVECPVRPPMCPSTRLAITRDRRLMLLAASGQGLLELRAIGQAFRWLCENRQLLAMALPQFSLDTRQMPGLRLMVDHADAHAELLQPLFELNTVQIQTYRRLRWAGKTGLLLEAA